MPEVLEKIKFTRDLCTRLDIRKGGKVPQPGKKTRRTLFLPFDIQVDGGINAETAKQCVEAGANVIVSGTYLYGVPNMRGCDLANKAIWKGTDKP